MFENTSKIGLSVDATVAKLRTYERVLERSIFLLASWTADLPEVEAKILVGDHLHKDATAVQGLRARIRSLGADPALPIQVPVQWQTLLNALAEAHSTPLRIYGMYEVLKPRLLGEMRRHLLETHAVWDEPTVIVLRQVILDLSKEIRWARIVGTRLQTVFGHALAGDVKADWEKLASRVNPAAEIALPAPAKPARDRRFEVVSEAPFCEVGDPESTATLLHTMLMSIEIITIEVCGRMIVDFPDMPFEFVLDMSRQCWDESRHSILCYDRIHELGFEIGQFPVDLELWELSFALPLELRLAVHQRLGEWLGTDGARLNADLLKKKGDQISSQIFEYVFTDEITHVAIGNKWIRFLAGNDNGVSRIHEAACMQRSRAGKTVAGPSFLPLNRRACELAGFTAQEIADLERARAAAPAGIPQRETETDRVSH